MPKAGCGMISFRNSLGVFGGFGIPRGPTEPHSLMRYTDGSGWTNEFHIYNLSEGVWSCPVTTGDRPPPCSGLTFTTIDDRRAVVFGGTNGEISAMNTVYIIDLITMTWGNLNKSEGESWPEGRYFHAACCLNYGQQYPQLLVTGGSNTEDKPLADAWILDIERKHWRNVTGSQKPRFAHSLTAISLGPGLTEVIEFGGSSDPSTGSDDRQPKIADTTLLQLRLVESSGSSEWELLSIVNNKQRGSQRMIEKLRYTVEHKQQSISKAESDSGMRRQLEVKVLEEERDQALIERREVEERVRVVEREAAEMVGVVEREVNERVRVLEETVRVIEREAAKMERERERARSENEERFQTMETERNKLEHEAARFLHDTEYRIKNAEYRISHAESLAKRFEIERNRMSEEKKAAELDRELMAFRVEGLEGERDQAIEDKQKAEAKAEIAEARLNAMEVEMQREIQTLEHRVMEAEEKAKMLEIEKEITQQSIVESIQHTATIEIQSERDRASKELWEIHDELKSVKIERSKAVVEKNRALEAKDKMEKRVKELEGKAKDMAITIEGERDVKMKEAEERGRVFEIEKNELKMELEKAIARAIELQRQLEKVEKKKQVTVHEPHLTDDQQSSSSEEGNDEAEVSGIIAEKTVLVTNQKQNIVWEGYGLRLHIPSNSLPEDCSQFELKMAASRLRQYKLPTDDGIPVSALYSFHHTLGDKELRQPVTIEMQHCATNSSTLSIVQAEDTSDMLEIIEGGIFDHREGYGVIKLHHFCSLGVYVRWFITSLIWTLKPCARLYYTNIKPRSFEFHLYIVPDLDAILEEIDSKVERKNSPFELGPISPFEFDEDTTTISLVLPEVNVVSGWRIEKLNVLQRDVDDIVNLRRDPIPFQVRVSWTGGEEEEIQPLYYCTEIIGAKTHDIAVISPDKCMESDSSISANPSTTCVVKPEDFARFPEPEMKYLLEIVGTNVQARWKRLGIGLGLDKSKLDALEKDCRGDTFDCMTEVFEMWSRQEDNEYSWENLAEVLCSEIVQEQRRLPVMYKKLSKMYAQL